MKRRPNPFKMNMQTKNPMMNKIESAIQNAKDAEAYANLMRQLPHSNQQNDNEDNKIYESVAEIQDLLAEINSIPD
jgi:hypothetical protein